MSRPSPETPRSSVWPLVFAFLGLSLGIMVLFFLTLGAIGPLLLIVGLIFTGIWVQWLIWGRWLSRSLKDDEPADSSDSQ